MTIVAVHLRGGPCDGERPEPFDGTFPDNFDAITVVRDTRHPSLPRARDRAQAFSWVEAQSLELLGPPLLDRGDHHSLWAVLFVVMRA
jgi:hypothetical protein